MRNKTIIAFFVLLFIFGIGNAGRKNQMVSSDPGSVCKPGIKRESQAGQTVAADIFPSLVATASFFIE